MTLSASLAEITQALVDKLTADMATLGLNAVFYGDQDKLSTTPMACVEPDVKKVMEITPFRKTTLSISVHIIIYHSAVTSPQLNKKNADLMAEAVETFLNADKNLKRTDGSDRVIHCYIEEVASGYVTKNKTPVRASRLTFSALTQDQLPQT